MSGEYDERFDELTGLVKTVVGRVDEMQLEMRDMRKYDSERFNEIDKRFDGIDKRFDGIDTRFDEMDKRFDKIEGEIYIGFGRQNDVISKVVEIQKTVNRISEAQAEQEKLSS